MQIQPRDSAIAAAAEAVVVIGRRTLGLRIVPLLVALSVLGMPALISAQPPESGAAVAEPEAAQEPAESPAPEDSRERVEQAIDDALDELENRLDELEEAVDEGEDRSEDIERRLEVRREALRRARANEVRRRVRRSARSHAGDQKISFGSDVRLDSGDVADDLIAIFGSVHAEGDVEGDVVAVGGSAYIDGRVNGDVVAVGGRVVLGPEAEVFGEITSVGGSIEKHEDATAHGRENEVSFGDGFTLDPFRWDSHRFDYNWFRVGNAFEFGWGVIALGLLLLMVCFVQLVAGDTVGRVGTKVASSPWASLLAGFLVWVLTFPVFLIVFVILCVTVIGIPIALLVALGTPIVFFVASLVGFAGVALVVGRWLEKRFSWKLGGPILTLVVGVVAIQALSLAGDMISVAGGFLSLFALMFTLSGFFVKLVVWMAGLGAVVLTAFGRKAPPAPIDSSATVAPPAGGGELASPPPAVTGDADSPSAEDDESEEPTS